MSYRYIYSCTCIATNRQTGERKAQNIPFQFSSAQEQEAEYYALEQICKSVYPTTTYYKHTVLVERIEDTWILEAYKEIMKGR